LCVWIKANVDLLPKKCSFGTYFVWLVSLVLLLGYSLTDPQQRPAMPYFLFLCICRSFFGSIHIRLFAGALSILVLLVLWASAKRTPMATLCCTKGAPCGSSVGRYGAANMLVVTIAVLSFVFATTVLPLTAEVNPRHDGTRCGRMLRPRICSSSPYTRAPSVKWHIGNSWPSDTDGHLRSALKIKYLTLLQTNLAPGTDFEVHHHQSVNVNFILLSKCDLYDVHGKHLVPGRHGTWFWLGHVNLWGYDPLNFTLNFRTAHMMTCCYLWLNPAIPLIGNVCGQCRRPNTAFVVCGVVLPTLTQFGKLELDRNSAFRYFGVLDPFYH
jgi:hypothetical protein